MTDTNAESAKPPKDWPEFQVDLAAIEDAVRVILVAIGEEPDREGLKGTPGVARMYAEIFDGVHRDPGSDIDAFFGDEHYQEIVMVRDIPFYSACEHHLLPFHGKAHVAYSKGASSGSVEACSLDRRICPPPAAARAPYRPGSRHPDGST